MAANAKTNVLGSGTAEVRLALTPDVRFGPAEVAEMVPAGEIKVC